MFFSEPSPSGSPVWASLTTMGSSPAAIAWATNAAVAVVLPTPARVPVMMWMPLKCIDGRSFPVPQVLSDACAIDPVCTPNRLYPNDIRCLPDVARWGRHIR